MERDLAGLNAKEARAVKMIWHRAAKRYLHHKSITSDPIPLYPNQNPDGTFKRGGGEKVPLAGLTREKQMAVIEAALARKKSFSDFTKPWFGFWWRRERDDLIDLYRATKPKR